MAVEFPKFGTCKDAKGDFPLFITYLKDLTVTFYVVFQFNDFGVIWFHRCEYLSYFLLQLLNGFRQHFQKRKRTLPWVLTTTRVVPSERLCHTKGFPRRYLVSSKHCKATGVKWVIKLYEFNSYMHDL